MQTAKTLIRLGRCPGWSESSLGAQVIFLVLPCGGSFLKQLICISVAYFPMAINLDSKIRHHCPKLENLLLQVISSFNFVVLMYSHPIGGNLKLLRESTNADRKQLKIVFLIANCDFRLPICNLKYYFNAYRSALLDSRDSLRLPPIRSGIVNGFFVQPHILFTFITESECMGGW